MELKLNFKKFFSLAQKTNRIIFNMEFNAINRKPKGGSLTKLTVKEQVHAAVYTKQ